MNQPPSFTDNDREYKGHIITPIRYGENGQYNWTTRIDNKPFDNQGPWPHTQSEAIARAKAEIDKLP